jgi:pimeloyl-ACP methyl ester carboxylesterase
MIDISKIDYSELDTADVLGFLFHPRPEFGESILADNSHDLMIPVDDDHHVGARLHSSGKSDPMILFFHGNGEIVSDYDDLGPLFNRLGINFFPVDYRGYGRSTGTPTITNMMRDCHMVFDYAVRWLKEDGYTGSLIIMGRSLGSASALELAVHYEDEIDGLIIESGFASMEGLYERLGIARTIPEEKKKGLSNVDKIATFKKPTLVIHAEFDHIIPFSAGTELHDAAGAPEKTLLKIPGANHNDIFFRGMEAYLEAVIALVETIKKT